MKHIHFCQALKNSILWNSLTSMLHKNSLPLKITRHFESPIEFIFRTHSFKRSIAVAAISLPPFTKLLNFSCVSYNQPIWSPIIQFSLSQSHHLWIGDVGARVRRDQPAKRTSNLGLPYRSHMSSSHRLTLWHRSHLNNKGRDVVWRSTRRRTCLRF